MRESEIRAPKLKKWTVSGMRGRCSVRTGLRTETTMCVRLCEVWSVSDVCCESEVFVVAGTDTAHNTHNDTHTLAQHLIYREKSVSFESSIPVLHSKCAMQSMQMTPATSVSAEASCLQRDLQWPLIPRLRASR